MNNLKKLRQERGLTLDQLIKEIKLIAPTMNTKQWEVCENSPINMNETAFWSNIADYFEVDLAYLYGLSIFKDQYATRNQMMDYEDRLAGVDEFCENQVRGIHESKRNKSV